MGLITLYTAAFISVVAGKDSTPVSASSGLFGQCRPDSAPQICSVSVGPFAPPKQGTCSSHSDSGLWCDIGQKAPCVHKGPDEQCSFEGVEGKCAVAITPSSEPFCNIWPIVASDTFELKDTWCPPFSAATSCSLAMGSTQLPQQGVCSYWSSVASFDGVSLCDAGQLASCSDKTPGSRCIFAEKEGSCNSGYQSSRLYCDIWPITEDLPAGAASIASIAETTATAATQATAPVSTTITSFLGSHAPRNSSIVVSLSEPHAPNVSVQDVMHAATTTRSTRAVDVEAAASNVVSQTVLAGFVFPFMVVCRTFG